VISTYGEADDILGLIIDVEESFSSSLDDESDYEGSTIDLNFVHPPHETPIMTP
jgi:hypothetical protein